MRVLSYDGFSARDPAEALAIALGAAMSALEGAADFHIIVEPAAQENGEFHCRVHVAFVSPEEMRDLKAEGEREEYEQRLHREHERKLKKEKEKVRDKENEENYLLAHSIERESKHLDMTDLAEQQTFPVGGVLFAQPQDIEGMLDRQEREREKESLSPQPSIFPDQDLILREAEDLVLTPDAPKAELKPEDRPFYREIVFDTLPPEEQALVMDELRRRDLRSPGDGPSPAA